MRLHYFSSVSDKYPHGNFGDELNAVLWPRIVGDLLDDRSSDWAVLVGVGTILNSSLTKVEGERFVLGSGAGYGDPLLSNEKISCLAVRGPLTAAALGIDPTYAVTDAALLIRNFMGAADPKQARSERPVAFMPHWTSGISDWQRIADRAGHHFIDPTLGVERVINEIAGSRLLIAEAMHGAIVADALRVPWIAVRTWPGIHQEKWMDWTRSMELKYRPADLFLKRFSLKSRSDGLVHSALTTILPHRLKKIARLLPQLSQESVLVNRLEGLNRAVDVLRREIAKGQEQRSSATRNGLAN